LSIIPPDPGPHDTVYDTSDPSGFTTFEDFAVHCVSSNPCASEDLIYTVETDRSLPDWLTLSLDPHTNRVIWSSVSVPTGFHETFTITIIATLMRDKDSSSASTVFNLTVMSPQPFLKK
jgi:hypothetical protein